MFIYLLPAIFFGWSLGANDAANIFGTAVSNRIIKYRTATIISAIFIILGAIISGEKGILTISSISASDLKLASISVLASAITMTTMTYIGVPVSSSQAIVGSIIATSFIEGTIKWRIFLKLFLAWFLTPIGGIFFSYITYKIFAKPFNKIKSISIREKVIFYATLIIGAYGSYSLGANNVANITGVFANSIGVKNAALLGGISIAFGVLTYSYKVMYTVGVQIIELDYYSSAIAVFGESITVWIYALLGIPISTSQAIVGAVIGAGYARGSRLSNKKIILKIVSAWVNTPVIAGSITFLIYYLVK
ncbi:phosphate permease [Thermosipho melanesiensis]|uniref:Phosphate permease n=1 Tax=Thermosipho melanesiensis TaxID=46541 RepID=A0ABM6GE52_9BACT|nr:phosphate permease [Thermosipho melanesiensis]OOC36758.1 phosphate permease [Thermosipho melanesiensis]OOC39090.1 phosphate permease [Thermosipho melanesiensis]OOC39238.1 phosphate permease [Thermosipho melanesiensis]OOC41765.1 phosphate permease [Thermosipho melanesiensis]